MIKAKHDRPKVTTARVGKELPVDQAATPIFEPRNRRERRALAAIKRKGGK
jgi:hypothetical protein